MRRPARLCGLWSFPVTRRNPKHSPVPNSHPLSTRAACSRRPLGCALGCLCPSASSLFGSCPLSGGAQGTGVSHSGARRTALSLSRMLQATLFLSLIRSRPTGPHPFGVRRSRSCPKCLQAFGICVAIIVAVHSAGPWTSRFGPRSRRHGCCRCRISW